MFQIQSSSLVILSIIELRTTEPCHPKPSLGFCVNSVAFPVNLQGRLLAGRSLPPASQRTEVPRSLVPASRDLSERTQMNRRPSLPWNGFTVANVRVSLCIENTRMQQCLVL